MSARGVAERLLGSFVAAWNAHDPRRMAEHWVRDGDLLNTRGRWARGRDQVEQLLRQEHQGPLRASLAALALEGVRPVGLGHVWAEARMQMANVEAPDGTHRTVELHVAFLLRRTWSGRWRFWLVRPYAFLRGF